MELSQVSKDKAGGVPCADGIDEETNTEAASPRIITDNKQPNCADFMTNALLFYSKAGRIMFKIQSDYPV